MNKIYRKLKIKYKFKYDINAILSDLLKVSEGRWQIEECFRIMKTDFSARPVYLQDENRIKAHFLICFLALTIYRFLEKKLDSKYTCEEENKLLYFVTTPKIAVA